MVGTNFFNVMSSWFKKKPITLIIKIFDTKNNSDM